MRHRELIKRLKDARNRLRAINQSARFSVDTEMAQHKCEKRQSILHGLESLLPEIIEKLER